MEIYSIQSGFFKLDGGAMFGVVPKKMWEKMNPPDEMNLCTWSMRCLLIKDGSKNILIDCGIGDKQDEKFRSHFHPHGAFNLIDSLSEHSIQPEDITDVFLTHLHFDHCGGALKRDGDKIVPTFPNATYWSNQKHWDWAIKPNFREKASFLSENILPLQELGILKMIDVQQDIAWGNNIHIRFLYGHTEAMMCPIIKSQNQTFIYCADLIPSIHHIGMPYVMSYDVRPLETMKEKEWLLNYAFENNAKLILEHDPEFEYCTIIKNEKNQYIAGEKGKL